MTNLFIIPAGTGTEPYVELGSRGATGTVFKKHVLNLGTLHYQGRDIELDDAFYNRLQRNFEAGVSMVQAPVADASNKHSEDPLRNAGEVIGLERDGDKVYTVIDVRDPKVVQGLRNKTIMGASAMLSLDYTDSRTDKKVGPALLHHCFTNRPHVLDLDPYEEIVAATADSADMVFDSPIVLAAEENVPLTKDELLAQLRDVHGVDVAALEQAAAARVDLTAITDALRGAGTLQLSGESLTQTDVVGAIVELAGKNEQLATEVGRLSRKDAERTVDAYIGDGRLLAKSRDRMVDLALSGDTLDDFLAPADAPFIKMNAQSGLGGSDEDRPDLASIDEETTRLADISNKLAGRGPAAVRK